MTILKGNFSVILGKETQLDAGSKRVKKNINHVLFFEPKKWATKGLARYKLNHPVVSTAPVIFSWKYKVL